MPLITRFHHSQLPATPLDTTMPVTANGVSAENVVATIDVPASHHGASRPERKNSLVLPRARRAQYSPMARVARKYRAMMIQSKAVRFMASHHARIPAEKEAVRRPRKGGRPEVRASRPSNGSATCLPRGCGTPTSSTSLAQLGMLDEVRYFRRSDVARRPI